MAGNAQSRAQLIDAFLAAPTGTVPVTQFTGETREVTLEVRDIEAEIAPGVKVRQWAFGLPGSRPACPAPNCASKSETS
ncbi:hypothetical protein ACFSC4_27060 [Deinococcus malanensis]|uniref:hypothetical protein n=1 Tax=Deinococcus malanensis TaxID=1706855 RepID=UPI003633FD94